MYMYTCFQRRSGLISYADIDYFKRNALGFAVKIWQLGLYVQFMVILFHMYFLFCPPANTVCSAQTCHIMVFSWFWIVCIYQSWQCVWNLQSGTLSIKNLNMLENKWQLKEKSNADTQTELQFAKHQLHVCSNGSANLLFCIVNILKLCCSSLETCCSIIQALVTNRSLQIRHAPSDLEDNEKKTKFFKNVHLYHGLKLVGGVLSASIISERTWWIFFKIMMDVST